MERGSKKGGKEKRRQGAEAAPPIPLPNCLSSSRLSPSVCRQDFFFPRQKRSRRRRRGRKKTHTGGLFPPRFPQFLLSPFHPRFLKRGNLERGRKRSALLHPTMYTALRGLFFQALISRKREGGREEMRAFIFVINAEVEEGGEARRRGDGMGKGENGGNFAGSNFFFLPPLSVSDATEGRTGKGIAPRQKNLLPTPFPPKNDPSNTIVKKLFFPDATVSFSFLPSLP